MNDTEVPSRLFNQELKLRAISAVILAALILLMTWIGGYTFSLLWSVVSFAIYYEFCRICGEAFPGSVRMMGYAGLALVNLAFHGALGAQVWVLFGGAILVLLVWEMILNRSAWAATGLGYAVLPFIAMSELRDVGPDGLIVILVLFGAVWGADIMAYFFGRTLGGPKLAPRISPKKTWSGFIGSLVGGLGLAFAVILVAGFSTTAAFAMLVLLLVIVSQIGDLVESSLKRKFSIKDSGNLIPGHGGILDRIDGLIPASIVLWMVLKYLVIQNAGETPLGSVFTQVFLAS